MHTFKYHRKSSPAACNLVKFSRLAVICNSIFYHSTHTHTHTVVMAIFPGKPGLVGCPLNAASPFIPKLHILLGQA